MTCIVRSCCLLALTTLMVAGAAASPEHVYRIRRSAVLPGHASSGGDWSLRGTLGQHDAGRHEGDGYRLRGGLWPRGHDRIFRDGFDD